MKFIFLVEKIDLNGRDQYLYTNYPREGCYQITTDNYNYYFVANGMVLIISTATLSPAITPYTEAEKGYIQEESVSVNTMLKTIAVMQKPEIAENLILPKV